VRQVGKLPRIITLILVHNANCIFHRNLNANGCLKNSSLYVLLIVMPVWGTSRGASTLHS